MKLANIKYLSRRPVEIATFESNVLLIDYIFNTPFGGKTNYTRN